MEVKPQTFWTIAMKDMLTGYGLYWTRRDAIADLVGMHDPPYTWKELKAFGYRAIRVVVMPVNSKKA